MYKFVDPTLPLRTSYVRVFVKENKQFRSAVILRRIVTALETFGLFSAAAVSESGGAVLDHRLDAIPDAVHIAKRFVLLVRTHLWMVSFFLRTAIHKVSIV